MTLGGAAAVIEMPYNVAILCRINCQVISSLVVSSVIIIIIRWVPMQHRHFHVDL